MAYEDAFKLGKAMLGLMLGKDYTENEAERIAKMQWECLEWKPKYGSGKE